MNKKLAVQTKELMLEILDWTMNSNKKLALEVINEVAEQVLSDMNEWLKDNEEIEKYNEDGEPSVEMIHVAEEASARIEYGED